MYRESGVDRERGEEREGAREGEGSERERGFSAKFGGIKNYKVFRLLWAIVFTRVDVQSGGFVFL